MGFRGKAGEASARLQVVSVLTVGLRGRQAGTAAIQAGFDFLLAPSANFVIDYGGSLAGCAQNNAFAANPAWKF